MPTPNAHALLSASSAHRWLKCTAAPRYEENFPSGTSEYAEEGTLAHSICELYGRKKFTVMSTRKFNAELKKLQANPLYCEEMLHTAEAYVEYLTEKAMGYTKMPHVTFEVRVDLTDYIPDGFGTCDNAMIGDATLHITDYKHGKPNDTLSQLIRTAFVSAPGHVLIDADFSAIEARVISWLADQEWRLEVFRTHGKIYEASASQMFNVPLERIKKGNPEYELRQRGKVAELALGYQGSVSAMRAMDTGHQLDSLSDDEVKEIVNRWRDTNPKIRDLWYAFDSAAIQVIQNGGSVNVRCVTFAREYDATRDVASLTIRLPSGRKLFYVDPAVGENRWGNPSITYMGVNDKNKWGRIETYGGKLVENCVQAIARDCLAQSIENLEAAGFPVVFHVHDEVVIDIEPFADEETMLDKVVAAMSMPIPWAAGLPLNAAGWVGTFFKKD